MMPNPAKTIQSNPLGSPPRRRCRPQHLGREPTLAPHIGGSNDIVVIR